MLTVIKTHSRPYPQVISRRRLSEVAEAPRSLLHAARPSAVQILPFRPPLSDSPRPPPRRPRPVTSTAILDSRPTPPLPPRQPQQRPHGLSRRGDSQRNSNSHQQTTCTAHPAPSGLLLPRPPRPRPQWAMEMPCHNCSLRRCGRCARVSKYSTGTATAS